MDVVDDELAALGAVVVLVPASGLVSALNGLDETLPDRVLASGLMYPAINPGTVALAGLAPLP